MRLTQRRLRVWTTLILGLLPLLGCDSTGGAGTATPVAAPPQASIFSSTGAGGVICRAGAAPKSPCAPAATGAVAAVNDTVKVAAQGTLGAQAATVKIRLLAGAQMQLKARTDLGLGQKFILEAGQALFDHRNGQGEIEVEAHSMRVQPLDTDFSVSADADGGASVAVITGTRGVVVTSTLGLTTQVGAGHQLDVDATGHFMGTETLSKANQQLWATYGRGLDLAVATPTP